MYSFIHSFSQSHHHLCIWYRADKNAKHTAYHTCSGPCLQMGTGKERKAKRQRISFNKNQTHATSKECKRVVCASTSHGKHRIVVKLRNGVPLFFVDSIHTQHTIRFFSIFLFGSCAVLLPFCPRSGCPGVLVRASYVDTAHP